MGAHTVPANTSRPHAAAPRAPHPVLERGVLVAFVVCLVLLAAVLASSPIIHLDMGAPQSAPFLAGFGQPETSATRTFRWSERGAYVETFGLLRQPTLLRFEAASMRPPDAHPALTSFSTRTWRTPTFELSNTWREYTILLPPTFGQQQLHVDIEPFRAPGNDRRRLGATFTALELRPLDQSVPWTAFTILGWPRLLALLAFSILAWVLAARAMHRLSLVAAVLPVGVLLGLGAAAPLLLAVRDPIGAVQAVPDQYWPPVLVLQAAIVAHSALRRSAWLERVPDRMLVAGLFGVALLQTAVYLWLIPPWWHYDEAGHFEYVWILATYGRLPPYDDIAASIPIPGADGDALGHPPFYYLLLSLPIRLVLHADPVIQLSVARALSASLLPATILVAFGVIRDLTPPGHALRVALPLSLALLPPFADVMTGVTNDAPVVFCGALFAWGAVRFIRYGSTVGRLALLLGPAALAALFKNTGIVLVALAPLIVAVQLWRQHGIRRRWLVAVAGVLLLGLPLIFSVNEPAFWMRWNPNDSGQAFRTTLPDGTQVLRITPMEPYGPSTTFLANRILPPHLAELRGKPVTIGAWVWANQPTRMALPGLQAQLTNVAEPQLLGESAEVGTRPQFVAWTTIVPADTAHLFVVVQAPPNTASADLAWYVQDIVLAPGEFPGNAPPTFADPAHRSGTWKGLPFENLVRNATLTQEGLALNPRLGAQLPIMIVRRAPLRTVASMLDTAYSMPLLVNTIMPEVIYSFFARFAWFHAILPGMGWYPFFGSMALFALLGCISTLVRPPDPHLRPILLALGLIGAGVWSAMLFQQYDPGIPAFIVPFPRYGYPAIVPTMLALLGGLAALAPVRLRPALLSAILTGLLMLNVFTIGEIYARWP